MTPFRQLIRHGQSGSDVLAVKRAMKKMGVAGSKKLVTGGSGGSYAGDVFVKCVETVQHNHRIKSDGIYGKDTHAVIAPHFDLYGVSLYKAAKIRKPPIPGPPHLTAQKAAQRLLELSQKGRYHADNPGDLVDIRATANGKAVWSGAIGRYVHVDARPLEILIWLIESHGYRIGTYAICSDHRAYDGPRGHNGGYAVDISSINGISIGSWSAKLLTLQVATFVHNAPGELKPWQQICDGFGYQHNAEIAAQCIPYAGFYNAGTLAGHRNHIHVGYAPR